MTNPPSDKERPPLGFKDSSTNQTYGQPPIAPRNFNDDFKVEGDPVPTPEEQAHLRKMRGEKLANDKGKVSAHEQAKKDNQIRAKKREADAMKLKVIKLRREELESKEKALRASLEETEALGVTGFHREKRIHDEEKL